MASTAYARRYSQAVFEIALEEKELERWQSDLSKIVSTVGDADISAFLESPRFRFDDKVRLITAGLEGISPLALNLVKMLVVKGRLNMMGDIAAGYQQLLDGYHGIEQAELVTAVPLDDAGKVKVAEYLGDIVGKKVVIKAETSPDLIGGIVIRIGGKLLDGSTRHKLETLKRDLVGMER
ncbi:ATP synthase F1 subunit delta [Chloroflexota bacterium]